MLMFEMGMINTETLGGGAEQRLLANVGSGVFVDPPTSPERLLV